MKAWSFIILMAFVLIGCGHRDPIDRIVKKESANPYFGNGGFVPIRLPKSASPTEVVGKIFGKVKILETREVQIPAGTGFPPEVVNYTAVLVDRGFDQKVVFLKFVEDKHRPPGGWWSQVYDL